MKYLMKPFVLTVILLLGLIPPCIGNTQWELDKDRNGIKTFSRTRSGFRLSREQKFRRGPCRNRQGCSHPGRCARLSPMDVQLQGIPPAGTAPGEHKNPLLSSACALAGVGPPGRDPGRHPHRSRETDPGDRFAVPWKLSLPKP